ncbi:MxcI [Sandaracinus amylolyticus]|uniref:MxcI n=1 Tax=Sandaracinus amylolyticus TaxID=927083 RepID=UPI001F2F1D54|nr:MxcI [Sandaracinus amylolyticus]UJR86788.1 Hypothetical protein I5071_88890 [Sandaracinus amylolyticus]
MTIRIVLTTLAMASFTACGSETPRDGAPDAGASPDGGGTTASYAVTTTVFDDTTAATYVAVLDSLDGREVDLSAAREFAGWSSVAAHDEVLFVGHGERPEVERYTLTANGTLGDAEQTVSFAAHGLSSASLSFNTFVDATMAHMGLEQTSRILWDPTEMAIVGSVDTPQVAPERDGMTVTAANFQGRVVRDDAVFQPYFWHDADWYAFHQESQIAIYARDGSLETLLDVPCPALQIATQDEQGNLYFSGMVDTIAYDLVEEASTLERCVARIDAGERTIAEGWPRRFEELTEGRPAGVFHYLADGIGILTVYHVENADPTSPTFLDDWYAASWGLWLVNLEDWRAEPIEEWPLGSSNIFFSRLDGRLFVHRVEADFSSTTISEIAIDGSFEERLTVRGYAAYPLLRLR